MLYYINELFIITFNENTDNCFMERERGVNMATSINDTIMNFESPAKMNKFLDRVYQKKDLAQNSKPEVIKTASRISSIKTLNINGKFIDVK